MAMLALIYTWMLKAIVSVGNAYDCGIASPMREDAQRMLSNINSQAEDRLHRIGQKNAVQVIDIIARNTVDLGRMQRLELKKSWIRQILGDPV